MDNSLIIQNSYISQIYSSYSSLTETTIHINDTSVITNINILSKEISDRIKENKELQEFIKESIDVISKNNNKIWSASLEKNMNDDDNQSLKFHFYTQIAFEDKSNLQSYNFDYHKTSVYNRILDLLLDKSDELIDTVILDESFL